MVGICNCWFIIREKGGAEGVKSLQAVRGYDCNLGGEMSLVGTRLLLMEYLPVYSTEQFRRHEVKPGVTG